MNAPYVPDTRRVPDSWEEISTESNAGNLNVKRTLKQCWMKSNLTLNMVSDVHELQPNLISVNLIKSSSFRTRFPQNTSWFFLPNTLGKLNTRNFMCLAREKKIPRAIVVCFCVFIYEKKSDLFSAFYFSFPSALLLKVWEMMPTDGSGALKIYHVIIYHQRTVDGMLQHWFFRTFKCDDWFILFNFLRGSTKGK